MRKDNLGLVNDKYVANLRRKVADLGMDAAAVVNCDEASKGRDSWELFFRRFLLLCGNTASDSASGAELGAFES